jgi:hypothetical protein
MYVGACGRVVVFDTAASLAVMQVLVEVSNSHVYLYPYAFGVFYCAYHSLRIRDE